MVEGARLESEYTAKPYRGFESLPLRHLTDPSEPQRASETHGFSSFLEKHMAELRLLGALKNL